MAKLTLRIDLDNQGRVGPGKIRLLELIDETGSISAAGRALDMSYRRAWLLIDNLNTIFRERVVVASTGGQGGGGAELTQFGRALIQNYRSMETKAAKALAEQMNALETATAPQASGEGPPDGDPVKDSPAP